MFTFEMKVGRLVETRIAGTLDADGLRDLVSAMLKLVPRLPPDGRVISITDLRQARPLPVEVAEQMILLLKGAAVRTEREAALVGGNRVLAMQLERLQKEIGNDGRHVFTDEEPALDFLRPLATAAELARARKFLLDGRAR